MLYITKTTYLEYLACAKNTWLKLHKPELAAQFELSAFEKNLTSTGNLVELWARKLFPSGVLIASFGQEAETETKKYLDQQQTVIFQSTFIKDSFLVRNDVLEYNPESDDYNLYEIKGTNSLDENSEEIDHVEDATFQYAVLNDLNIKVRQVYLIHLNKDYVRGEEISVSELFIKEDITDKVLERLESTRVKMNRAVIELFQTDEKALECQCVYLGRSKHCSTFAYSHPEVPKYSIHDLSRIGNSKKKLAELVNSGILDLNEVPVDFKLSDIQRNQVTVHQSQKPLIDYLGIRTELENLQYSLYFLDYETYPSAIPLFKGYKPYQQIPFQFSLHVLNGEDDDLSHFEYLHQEASDPTEAIISALRETIGPEGHIIVWNKKFEQGRNSELAERSPENALFLNNLNERIYDLMDVFQKQFYVHPNFKGRTSIKKILPVLVPHLNYQDLEIKEGGAAMDAWFEKIFKSQDETEQQQTAENLLKYCYLDTYAMYMIWKELTNLI